MVFLQLIVFAKNDTDDVYMNLGHVCVLSVIYVEMPKMTLLLTVFGFKTCRKAPVIKVLYW